MVHNSRLCVWAGHHTSLRQRQSLPEAIAALRQVRKRALDGEWLALSALDPLNLVGTVVAGAKVPRQLGARVLWRDGTPVATLVAGEVAWLTELPAAEQRVAHKVLMREPDLYSAGLDLSADIRAWIDERVDAIAAGPQRPELDPLNRRDGRPGES